MTSRSHFLFAALLLAVTGCRFTESTSSSWSGSYTDPYASSSSGSGYLDVQAGHQAGAMGQIASYDGEATRMQGTHDAYSSYVQLDSIGRGWWVMTAFNFDVDVDALVPGQTYVLDPSGASSTVPGPTGVPQPLSLTVRGCSGPSDGDYTFDDLATQGSVVVTELPGGLRRLSYDLTFVNDAGATQRATGTFDWQPGSGSGSTGPSVAVLGI